MKNCDLNLFSFKIAITFVLAFFFMLFFINTNAKGDVAINSANFPDKVFREWISEFDNNENNNLSDGELRKITMVPDWGYGSEYAHNSDEKPHNYDGINKLTYLEEIYIRGTLYGGYYPANYFIDEGKGINSLDLSGLKYLEVVECPGIGLKELNVNNCTSLETLDCGSNYISELNTSSCKNLYYVDCRHNKLKKYDFSGSVNYDVSGNDQDTVLDLESTSSGYVINFQKISSTKYKNIRVDDEYLDGATFSNGKITWKKLNDVPKQFVYEYPFYSNDYMTINAKINKNFKDISSLKISLDQTEYLYDGSAKQPIPTITDGSYTLIKGTDYKVVYSNNIGPGTGLVTITGIGKYSGTVKKEFTVGYSLGDVMIQLDQTEYIYNGTPIKPIVKVYKESTLLVQNTDYYVEYIQNDEPGTGIIIIRGKGIYIGNAYSNFHIVKSVKLLNISLSGTSFNYTGYQIKPTVYVYDGSNKLKENTHYKLVYSSNTYGASTVVVNGCGDYCESVTLTYTIYKPISYATISLSQTEYDYDGYSKTPTVTVKDGNDYLRKNTDYTVEYLDNKNAGKGKVIVTGKGYYNDSITVNFTIKPRSIENYSSSFRLNTTSYTYNGQPILPKVSSGKFIEGTDYYLSYRNSTDIGTATLYVIGQNNYTGQLSFNYEITKEYIGDAILDVIYNESQDYFGEPIQPYIYIKLKSCYNSSDYKISYVNNYLDEGVSFGYGEIIVEGIRNLTGTQRYSFSLTRKTSSDSYFYNPVYDTNSWYSFDGDDTDYDTSYNQPNVKKPAKAVILKTKRKRKKIKISLKKIKNAYGYTIRFYYKKKDAKKNKNFFHVFYLSKKTKCTIKMPNNKKCYVRVRAYNKRGIKIVNGKWSKLKKVK